MGKNGASGIPDARSLYFIGHYTHAGLDTRMIGEVRMPAIHQAQLLAKDDMRRGLDATTARSANQNMVERLLMPARSKARGTKRGRGALGQGIVEPGCTHKIAIEPCSGRDVEIAYDDHQRLGSDLFQSMTELLQFGLLVARITIVLRPICAIIGQ